MATCKSCLEWRKGKVFRPLLYNTFLLGNEFINANVGMWKYENVEMVKSPIYLLEPGQRMKSRMLHFHISTFPHFHISTFV